MNLMNFLSDLISPVTNLIDEMHTSDEEAMTLRNAITKVQNQFGAKVLEYEAQITQLQAKVITAEAQGASFLQRNWRPITMLTFLSLIVVDVFGWTEFRLAEEAWELLKIGIGGYVIGRSAEKIVPGITEAIKDRP